MFNSFRKHARAAATIGVASALAVGGVAVAQSDSGDGNGSHKGKHRSGKRMPPPPGGPIGGSLARNLTYAELHVQRNGEAEVVRMDRGEVVTVDASSITVRENDGNEVTIAVDEDTKVLAGPRRNKEVTDLREGQSVIVCGPEGGAAKAILLPPKRGQMPRGPHAGPRGAQQGGQFPPPPPGAQMRG